jgi:hypothetical protein
MPLYVVRHLDGEFEELSCFRQLEDEGAAMYFQISFTARKFAGGSPRKEWNYVLVARDAGTGGLIEEREIALFDAS